MPTLAELQASLARRLTGDPAAESDSQIRHAARALQQKRMRAVAQLLPRTCAALGAGWPAAFSGHANRYMPCGLLYHVDDAWEFARTQLETNCRQAAQLDLAWLDLKYVRGADRGAQRVRERTGLYFKMSINPLRISMKLRGRRPILLNFSRAGQ